MDRKTVLRTDFGVRDFRKEHTAYLHTQVGTGLGTLTCTPL